MIRVKRTKTQIGCRNIMFSKFHYIQTDTYVLFFKVKTTVTLLRVEGRFKELFI